MARVTEAIVRNDLCCGCGVCVSICPRHILGIRFNKYGEYEAYLKQDCEKECDMCYSVCPFGNDNPNEDEIGQRWFADIPGIQHNAETGYHLFSFVGHSERHRQAGASGGMATWLLTTLLSNGEIDAAICVSPSNEPGTLFKYSVMRDTHSIESSSGSAYYPVQLSDVLTYVINTPGRYAITALPCFAKAIRLAQMRNKILKERIMFIVGITCGQMKSKQYTDYLVALSGVTGDVFKVSYRGKDTTHPASDYYFYCENFKGEKGKVFFKKKVSEAWLSRWFTLNACNFCDDIFAECADLVCMDAWLPEYVSDWRGTTILLIRNPDMLVLVKKGMELGENDMAPVPIEKVIQSQIGLIKFKRHALKARLWIAEKGGSYAPIKRVAARRDVNQISMMRSRALYEIQIQSKERYLEWRDAKRFDLAIFHKSMEPYQKKIRTFQKISAMNHTFQLFIKKLRRNS